MNTYQRVYIPMGDHQGEPLRLYGMVRIVDGEPEHTYCCQLTPLVWVEPLGWDTPDEDASSEPPDGGYFEPKVVLASLSGSPAAYEDEDEAREEMQGNW